MGWEESVMSSRSRLRYPTSSDSPDSASRRYSPSTNTTSLAATETKSKYSPSRGTAATTAAAGAEKRVMSSASGVSVGGSGTGHLAQQIHDEFLTCKICLEGFTNPKSLNCLHTFCEECIEQHANSEGSYKKYSDYREFCCPLCRKRTSLPLGGVKKLPDNFLVSSLGEVIGRQKPSKFPFCDICKLVSRKHREASSKCLDCAKLLCKACVEQHLETKVTRSHNIFDVEIEKDIECKEHRDEVVRFYCEPCETCVCVLCTFNEHKDHEISQFGEAVFRYKANMQNLLDDCKEKLTQYEKHIETVVTCDSCIKQAEQRIQDLSISMIGEIRTREKSLVEEIHNIYGNEAMSLIEKKAEMQATLDGLKSTCTLTELILGGKDMELLLLKKQVSEKLETLSKNAVSTIPKSMSKAIQFVPGSLDMGYIHDQERPLLSKGRRAFSTAGYGGEVYDETNVICSETQTDPSLFQMPEASVNTDAVETANKNVLAQPTMRDKTAQATEKEILAMTGAAASGGDSSSVKYPLSATSSTSSAATTTGDEVDHRSRRQQAASSSTTTSTYDSSEDPAVVRRRRRRDRAKTARLDALDRYSYHDSVDSAGTYASPSSPVSLYSTASVTASPPPTRRTYLRKYKTYDDT